MSYLTEARQAAQGAMERFGFDPSVQNSPAMSGISASFLRLTIELGPDVINPTVLDIQLQGEI